MDTDSDFLQSLKIKCDLKKKAKTETHSTLKKKGIIKGSWFYSKESTKVHIHNWISCQILPHEECKLTSELTLEDLPFLQSQIHKYIPNFLSTFYFLIAPKLINNVRNIFKKKKKIPQLKQKLAKIRKIRSKAKIETFYVSTLGSRTVRIFSKNVFILHLNFLLWFLYASR